MERTITTLPAKRSLTRLTRVAAYARVSAASDAMQHSLAAQISYYSDLIRKHPGWQYAGVYADEAMTGTKDNREQFQRLLTDCREGRIDMVITKAVSRFARNTVTTLEAVRELKAIGVDVYFEEQKIHSLSSDGELLLTILSAFAQEESRSASDNMKWRIRKGFENGELMNLRTMFGYRVTRENGIEIDPGQAAVVREMYARVIRGESLNAIAHWLNRSGCTGALGGKWLTARVRDVLSNEKYTGNSLLQKTFINNHMEKKKVKNNGELPQYYATETHPAIIDEKTFEAAQRALERIAARLPPTLQPPPGPATHQPPEPMNLHPTPQPPEPMSSTATHQTRPRYHHTFTGMIICPVCGKPYRYVKNHGMPRWACSTFIREGRSFCQSKLIPEDTIIHLACDILGWSEFSEEAFRKAVDHITAVYPHTLIFHLQDGRDISAEWQNRSRSESWTVEMRAKARR